MPRFFFDTDDGRLALPDDDGVDLESPAAALVEARGLVAAFSADVERHTGATLGTRRMAVTVRSEDGAAIFALKLTLSAERLDGQHQA